MHGGAYSDHSAAEQGGPSDCPGSHALRRSRVNHGNSHSATWPSLNSFRLLLGQGRAQCLGGGDNPSESGKGRTPAAPSSSSDLNRVGADLGKVDLARVGAEEGGEGP